MGHGHAPGHGHHHHGHDHDHEHEAPAALPAAFDTFVPDEALTPEQQSRRTLLRRAGLLGAGLTAASVLGQAAATAPAYAVGTNSRKRGGFLWLAGDHHLACRAGCPVLQGRGECPLPRSGAGGVESPSGRFSV